MAEIRKLKPNGQQKTINVALQGGGAHGAFGWGVLDRIAEDGRLVIEGLSATSAGAMNAVVYAYGQMKGGNSGAREQLELFWQRISETGKYASPIQTTPLDLWLRALGYRENLGYQLFESVTHLFSPYQFNPFGLNPLKDVLTKTVDFGELRQGSPTILRLCATNVRNGRPKIFTNEMLTPQAVLASACLPMLFQAVEVEGEHFWDGGYIGNPAIYPIIYDAQSPDILIVHINPIVRDGVPKQASEIFNRINEVSFNSSLMRELRAIAFATKLIDEDWIRPEHQHKLKRLFLHAIRSDEIMREFSVASKFDTSWSFLTQLRDMGRQLAGQWLDQHFDDIGQRSTVDLQRDYL
ncbi:patatin-like phospholipase family protein [Rhabdaerophilum sp. SD176]|uniref:patatin-like phospholipase family protein n=1 Tax=Rhabdaerophilum sp. SD176 TaxID=2983548 RepID=UPI0024DF39EC|nr:patatin-like phospholipase family protein [Rhabdaerophilum sp. SD176]